ncbi:MAG: CopD family protein [Pseudomonadota bacterium]
MEIFLGNYELLRALHIIAVIAWMAGLMYLPRLFVYHSKAEIASDLDLTLITMERKLFWYIMVPAMLISWVFGVCLILVRGPILWETNWFLVKLSMVSLITTINLFYGKWQMDFANSKRPLNHVFFRFINEAPFLLMIVAVLMVVLEPRI